MSSNNKKLHCCAVILGCMLAGAAYAWFAGADVNWDWQNYHDYSAYAFLNGRENDVAVAGIQTFLNPVAYVPAYLLRHYLGAPLGGLALGALQGLNLALIYWFSRLVLADAANRWIVAASVGIAAFSPMSLSEVGTSFADILTAPLVISGLYLLLFEDEQRPVHFLFAGICIGAAAGLKLTNMIFCLGACASLLFAARPLLALPCFAAGAAIGGLGTGGAWALALWQQFGNPVFPYFNDVFRSPEAEYSSIADLRFMPHDIWDALAYPFYWLVGDHRSSEGPFRDPRFALAFVLILIGFAASAFRKLPIFTRRDKIFLVFFLVSYLSWLLTFSIHRYAVGLELLAAPLVVVLLCRLTPLLQQISKPGRSWTSGVVLVAAAAVLLWSQPAAWPRRPWSQPYQPALPAPLLSPATYLLIDKPVGYIVPLFPQASRFYQLADILLPIVQGGSLDRRIRSGLADPLPGGMWAIHIRGTAPRQDLLDMYDLQFDTTRACQSMPGADYIDLEICPLAFKPANKINHHSA